MKLIFTLMVALFHLQLLQAQYIVVKARYTATRLVANAPFPDTRENRLVLSFYTVASNGNLVPASLNAQPVSIYKEGYQYGSHSGGVLDSNGNNYPGYTFTAPKVVSYHNSYGEGYIDCDPSLTTVYTANGHTLDCGFIPVSHWQTDAGTGGIKEVFTAPNVCLPYYTPPHPYAVAPGNLNFSWPLPATEPYNWYSYACTNGPQQFVVRGVLQADSLLALLPVLFDNVQAQFIDEKVRILFSNLTESDIQHYEVQRAADLFQFSTIAYIFPLSNQHLRVDYSFDDRTIPAERTLYYRIKAVEQNGTVVYSRIVAVTVPRTSWQPERLQLFPNPITQGAFTIEGPTISPGRYILQVMNTSGMLLQQKIMNHTGGVFRYTHDTHSLLRGTYFVTLRSENLSFHFVIVIR